uniref:Uncharacterized protein n=1 Tax=Zea mays TaxID=4577 RepID=C0PLD6_MAIZE|nr:unknown [Zea mays]
MRRRVRERKEVAAGARVERVSSGKPFPTLLGRGRKPCSLPRIGPGSWVTKHNFFSLWDNLARGFGRQGMGRYSPEILGYQRCPWG